MRRGYVFRLRPTARQHIALAMCVESHRELYNAALAERRGAWSHSKTGVNYGDQSAQLTEIRGVRPDQAVWSFSSQQATLRRLNKSFQGFFGRVKVGQPAGYPRFKGRARFDSVEWPKDGDGARWLPEARRVYLLGIGQDKVTMHRQVRGRVKTIQIKRQGRRWMLVLSCDDVAATGLPSTGRQAGVDVGVGVGVGSFATTSDAEHIANPRWGRVAAHRLAAAQQRLQRAKRKSKNRVGKRETVVARHRKIAHQRRDFHHKQARGLVENYDVLAVEGLKIANMVRRAKPGLNPCPIPTIPASSWPTAPGRSPGCLEASVTLAGASSSQYCAPKRKTLDAHRLRSIPGTPPMAASPAGTRHARTASTKRNSSANTAVIAPRPMNMPHATSCGPDWPFTPTRREKTPAASSRRRSHQRLIEPDDAPESGFPAEAT